MVVLKRLAVVGRGLYGLCRCFAVATRTLWSYTVISAERLGLTSADNDLGIISKKSQNSPATTGDWIINCDKPLFCSFRTLPSGSGSLHHAQQSEDEKETSDKLFPHR